MPLSFLFNVKIVCSVGLELVWGPDLSSRRKGVACQVHVYREGYKLTLTYAHIRVVILVGIDSWTTCIKKLMSVNRVLNVQMHTRAYSEKHFLPFDLSRDLVTMNTARTRSMSRSSHNKNA